MSKLRIYQIAKDLNVASKEIIGKLQEFDIGVKNHMSTLTDPDINLILEAYTQQDNQVSEQVISKDSETKPVKDIPKSSLKKETKDKPMKKGTEVPKKKVKEKPKEKPKVVTKEKPKSKSKDVVQEKRDDSKPNKTTNRNNTRQNTSYSRRPRRRTGPKPPKVREIVELIKVEEQITVGDLAKKLKRQLAEVIKKLMALGIMATVNENLDFDVASLIAEEFGTKVEKEIVLTDEDVLLHEIEDDPKSLKPRPPIVVVMGHVDHGKTSLLDSIRAAKVTDTEAGGITQHIGAYRVNVNGKEIAFLDTPGHEAFTAMRARGAQVTDIAILVVAADDGIMPQTIEAINHAKAANVSIIVAINKMDKPDANADRIKQELTEYGLVAEEWGGDTICVPVSALKGEGIDELLEMILLVTEMQELKANPDRLARGTVIESSLDKGRGPVATVLVQKGTLKAGDIIVAGIAVGRVRAMMDDKGKRVESAGPSTPVEIVGLSEVPDGGDPFYIVEDEKKARSVVEQRKTKIKDDLFKSQGKATLEDLFEQIKEGKIKDLNIIIKADVQGSAEAIRQSLEKLTNEEVKVNAIHGGVGGITESDVMLAAASNAIIIGFNVRPDSGARSSAELQDVEIRLYRIIYDAIEDIQAAMKGMLEPEYKEAITGHAEVREVFKVSGIGTIAGCYVTDGKINRNSGARIVRDGIVIHEGQLESLKRFKDDVREVAAGYECGIGLERFNDIKENDIIEIFIMEEIKR